MGRYRRAAHPVCGRALWLGILDLSVARRNGTVPDRDGTDATAWLSSTRARPSFHQSRAGLRAARNRRIWRLVAERIAAVADGRLFASPRKSAQHADPPPV